MTYHPSRWIESNKSSRHFSRSGYLVTSCSQNPFLMQDLQDIPQYIEGAKDVASGFRSVKAQVETFPSKVYNVLKPSWANMWNRIWEGVRRICGWIVAVGIAWWPAVTSINDISSVANNRAPSNCFGQLKVPWRVCRHSSYWDRCMRFHKTSKILPPWPEPFLGQVEINLDELWKQCLKSATTRPPPGRRIDSRSKLAEADVAHLDTMTSSLSDDLSKQEQVWRIAEQMCITLRDQFKRANKILVRRIRSCVSLIVTWRYPCPQDQPSQRYIVWPNVIQNPCKIHPACWVSGRICYRRTTVNSSSKGVFTYFGLHCSPSQFIWCYSVEVILCNRAKDWLSKTEFWTKVS